MPAHARCNPRGISAVQVVGYLMLTQVDSAAGPCHR
jgi:hypothetical protein